MALRKGTVAGMAACAITVGAIGWGGYSALSTLSWLRQAEASLGPQPLLYTSNVSAKGDRLSVFRRDRSAVAPAPNFLTVAPMQQAPVTTVAFAPTQTPDDLQATAAVPAPVASPQAAPPAQPRHVEKPKPPKPTNALLDDKQIASIKTRLRLTSDQEGYWPPVEAALRDVVKQQKREARKQNALGPVTIDVNSPEVQRLTWAAMPLLMRMREDQKREVRTLARVIGLDQVASQI
jgi:hypothetical protein